MYKEFFGLREPPFNLTPDPRFLYMSKRHREALAALVYGIKECKGFIVLTGEIGSGKTTLCRAFLKELNAETTNVALILNSFLSEVELLQVINDEFGIDSSTTMKKRLIDDLNKFLLDEDNKRKTNILIIDEAQNLSTAVLEQIRMLSNLETDTRKLIQIVLIGQPELNEILELPSMEQLGQRITVRYHISPLNKDEIYQYIRHRLHIAGAKINISMTPAALNRMFRISGGVPRKINLVADRALLAAYVAGQFQIDAKIIATAEKDIKWPKGRALGRGRAARPFVRLAWVLSVFLLGAALTAGGFWTGIQKGWWMEGYAAAVRSDSGGGQGNPGLEITPSPAVTPVPKPTAAPTPAPTPGLPGIAALPTPPAHGPDAKQWVYDENGIVRVTDPDFARIAALLTVAKMWMNNPFELDFFRNHEKEKIVGLNMLPIFRRPLVDLCSFERSSGLVELTRLDLPIVLDVEEPTGRLSPTVVLTRLDGQLCTLADPRLGRVKLGLPSLAPLVRHTTVVYSDPQDLTSLSSGREDDKIEELGLFLSRQGFWQEGEPSRVFGPDMTDALKRFQEFCGQEATGRLDGPTAASIVIRRLAYYPKLRQTAGNE